MISRLLSHYWTAADREETRQAQVEDWIDDVREFGPAIVAEACASWRRGNRNRPTPSDIRKLAIEEQELQLDRERSRTLRIAGPVDLDAWARGLGWSSYLERQDAIANNERRYARGLAWQAANAAEVAARPMQETVARATARAMGVSAEEILSPEEDRRARRDQREKMLREDEEPF